MPALCIRSTAFSALSPPSKTATTICFLVVKYILLFFSKSFHRAESDARRPASSSTLTSLTPVTTVCYDSRHVSSFPVSCNFFLRDRSPIEFVSTQKSAFLPLHQEPWDRQE